MRKKQSPGRGRWLQRKTGKITRSGLGYNLSKCDEFGYKCTPHAGISKIIYLSDKSPDRYRVTKQKAESIHLASGGIGVGETTDKKTGNDEELLTRYTHNETQ